MKKAANQNIISKAIQEHSDINNRENESIQSNNKFPFKKDASASQYLKRKLKQNRLLNENRRNVENQIKVRLLYVNNTGLKDKIKNFYLSLVNDLEFLKRFDIV